ncbi:MAG: bifunctional 4'-phosphopantothenoylcysteine decarboxylase/phosphopantothenoylcysteine synthetase, partial [Proteobacteria bacterium]|nr:bifunctional 4'-phosphopantothenoylcysteine decarboxylase/phosphopantothenoylcysteine synthetase [Pseudomonadota bacterium]
MLNFSNTNILLCVTGGIAAYKSAEIIRLFKKDGADVRVIMTESAKEFITPLTLQAV